jgi:hypothetical protein
MVKANLETPLSVKGHRPYINIEGQNCFLRSVKITQMCVVVSNINEQSKTYPFPWVL